MSIYTPPPSASPALAPAPAPVSPLSARMNTSLIC
jgi:hypothetical protein